MPGLTGHLSFNRSPVKPGMTKRKSGDEGKGKPGMTMRWPEIRGFSWLAHGTMALRPEIGRFLWPKRSPVKPGMTDRKAGDCILPTKALFSGTGKAQSRRSSPWAELRSLL